MLQRFSDRLAIETNQHQLLVDIGLVADDRNAELLGLQLRTDTLQCVRGLAIGDVGRGGLPPNAQRSPEQVLAFEQQPWHANPLGEPHSAASLLLRGALATSTQVSPGKQRLGEGLAAGQTESGEHARGLTSQCYRGFDALGLVLRQQQDGARECATRAPDKIADLGKLALRTKQAVQRVLEPAQSTTLGRQVEERPRVLMLQTDLFAQLQLLLAQVAGLVQEVEREVRLDQVQPRTDGQGDIAQAVEDVRGASQQVEGSAVASLAQGEVAQVDVDTGEGRLGALFRVHRAGRAIQNFGFPQTVEVG